MSRKTQFKAANGLFLDVENVGSSALFRVEVEHPDTKHTSSKPEFTARIELTDCEDLIRWEGFGTAGAASMLKKIDRTIQLLLDARKAMRRGAVEYAKLKKAYGK